MAIVKFRVKMVISIGKTVTGPDENKAATSVQKAMDQFGWVRDSGKILVKGTGQNPPSSSNIFIHIRHFLRVPGHLQGIGCKSDYRRSRWLLREDRPLRLMSNTMQGGVNACPPPAGRQSASDKRSGWYLGGGSGLASRIDMWHMDLSWIIFLSKCQSIE